MAPYLNIVKHRNLSDGRKSAWLVAGGHLWALVVLSGRAMDSPEDVAAGVLPLGLAGLKVQVFTLLLVPAERHLASRFNYFLNYNLNLISI